MCGIVGLLVKEPKLRPRLGELMVPMLIGMTERGPDSAGMAVFTEPVEEAQRKMSLYCSAAQFDWDALRTAVTTAFPDLTFERQANHAIIRTSTQLLQVRDWIKREYPQVHVLSAGRAIDLYKDIGLPAEIAARYHFEHLQGSHLVGHTRMATESAVTPENAHPYTAGEDWCLVHNGSLANPNSLKRMLEKRGIRFESDCDTEAACRYLEWRLQEGDDLEMALHRAFEDFDGFYTFLMGTRDKLALVRDPFACKPAIVAETDAYVAIASEFRSLAHLPGIKSAHVFEPQTGRDLLMVRVAPEVACSAVTFDMGRQSLREINQYLHRSLQGVGKIVIENPDGAHNLAVGINQPVDVEIRGHAGYYAAGMNQHACVRVMGNAGPGVAENMMSGRVEVTGFASASAGASAHGGVLVIRGDGGLRCGISLKGADIIVGGDVGSFSAFMAQAGRLVICGDAGEGLGDSIYEAVIYVRGSIKSLGADARVEPMSEEDRAALTNLLTSAEMSCDARDFKRIASAKTLYHWNSDAQQEY